MADNVFIIFCSDPSFIHKYKSLSLMTLHHIKEMQSHASHYTDLSYLNYTKSDYLPD